MSKLNHYVCFKELVSQYLHLDKIKNVKRKKNHSFKFIRFVVFVKWFVSEAMSGMWTFIEISV